MEFAQPATTPFSDASEMMVTRLPSWGDPILPEVWTVSEEEINEKFPLPGETVMKLSDCDSESLQMVTPFQQPIDNDMACLLRHSTDSFNDTMSDAMSEDSSMSSCESRDDGVSASTWSDTSDMDTSVHEQLLVQSPPRKAEWILEAYYGDTHNLCFRLRNPCGTYMILLADEVMGSLKAILEDCMTTIFFHIRHVDGQSTLVDSGTVLGTMSDYLDAQPKLLGPLEVRDESVCIRERPAQRTFLKRPVHGQNHLSNDPPADSIKRNNCFKISSAWRTLSGRSKIRPRPLARVE